MSTLNNNNNNDNKEAWKNLWCRNARVNNIIKILGRNPFTQSPGNHIRQCFDHSNCRGAHTKEEIRVLPQFPKWTRVDKTAFNFIEIYFEILTVINNEKSKMRQSIDEDIIKLHEKIKKINELNFIEIVQVWRGLACYYRKLAKELPKRKDFRESSINPQAHTTGYIYSEDLPCFYLNEKTEENVWVLSKITKFCKKQLDFVHKVDNKLCTTIWDVCLGDVNCKEGIHHIDEALCIDDFLTGKCDCILEVEHESKIDEITSIIKDITTQLSGVNIRPKRREQLEGILYNNKNKLNTIKRKIHYTEQGMKPFNIQLDNYNKLKEEPKKQLELDNKTKPSWDHKLADSPTGKVKKISLKTP